IGLEDDLLVRLPLDKLKRARAHRVLPELRAPLLHRARARDIEDEHGEVREERRLRGLERAADRVRADWLGLRAACLACEAREAPARPRWSAPCTSRARRRPAG